MFEGKLSPFFSFTWLLNNGSRSVKWNAAKTLFCRVFVFPCRVFFPSLLVPTTSKVYERRQGWEQTELFLGSSVSNSLVWMRRDEGWIDEWTERHRRHKICTHTLYLYPSIYYMVGLLNWIDALMKQKLNCYLLQCMKLDGSCSIFWVLPFNVNVSWHCELGGTRSTSTGEREFPVPYQLKCVLGSLWELKLV